MRWSTRVCASPRKGASAPTDADDRFDDSRHPRRTLASNGRDTSAGNEALTTVGTRAFWESARASSSSSARRRLALSPTSRRARRGRATTASALAAAQVSLCLCHGRERQRRPTLTIASTIHPTRTGRLPPTASRRPSSGPVYAAAAGRGARVLSAKALGSTPVSGGRRRLSPSPSSERRCAPLRTTALISRRRGTGRLQGRRLDRPAVSRGAIASPRMED